MGQGGNVWEWMGSAYDPANDPASEYRVTRGCGYFLTAHELRSSERVGVGSPLYGDADTGFRVAAIIPEPLEAVGVMGLTALGFLLCRRRTRAHDD